MTADREALVDAFVDSLRALLLADIAEERAPPVPNRDGRTLRVKEVAEFYRVTVKTVYGWVAIGILPALLLPGRAGTAGNYRFRAADLAEFDQRRACNWTPSLAPVVLTLAGEPVPIGGKSDAATAAAAQRHRWRGRAPARLARQFSVSETAPGMQ
jgi:hypothetical protein